MAEGKSTAEWASANWVAERTAQRWASEPLVRSEVEAIRRLVPRPNLQPVHASRVLG
ncbi:MAG: hypothetical protein ACLQVF_32270 [Isosphaeraceae bacterium]